MSYQEDAEYFDHQRQLVENERERRKDTGFVTDTSKYPWIEDDSWKDEVVTYDPNDIDTYPSVCNFPEDVQMRFGWTGGEQFTHRHIERVLRGEEAL